MSCKCHVNVTQTCQSKRIFHIKPYFLTWVISKIAQWTWNLILEGRKKRKTSVVWVCLAVSARNRGCVLTSLYETCRGGPVAKLRNVLQSSAGRKICLKLFRKVPKLLLILTHKVGYILAWKRLVHSFRKSWPCFSVTNQNMFVSLKSILTKYCLNN